MSCQVEQLPTILRIGSMAIAIYDYVWTLPYEARMLSSHFASRRCKLPSRPFMLFFFNRYVAIATVIISNIGFLMSGFSHAACHRFFWAAPTLKVFACLAAQLIVAVRTYGLSRKSPWVKWTMIWALFICFSVQMFVNLYRRVPLQSSYRNCTSGNLSHFKVAWLHYLAAMVFDLIALTISTGFILKHALPTQVAGCRLSGFSRAMFEQGILYYVCLTLINATNLVFYRQNKPAVQSSAASLGYVISWVMAQRILIDCTQYFATRSGVVIPAATIAVNGPMDSMFLASAHDVENPRGHNDHGDDTTKVSRGGHETRAGDTRVPGASPWLHFVSRAKDSLKDTTTGMFSISQTLGSVSGDRSLPVPSEEEIQGWKRPGAILGGDCSGEPVFDVETHRRMSQIYGYSEPFDDKGECPS